MALMWRLVAVGCQQGGDQQAQADMHKGHHREAHCLLGGTTCEGVGMVQGSPRDRAGRCVGWQARPWDAAGKGEDASKRMT